MKSRPQFSIPNSHFAVTYERHDEHRRSIVNHAITVQEEGNTVSAIEYLKAHEIASHVIERVLLEPARRRGPSPYRALNVEPLALGSKA